MRVLILSAAILAYASCAPAPSGTVLSSILPALTLPLATVSPGDIQAAAINAKVYVEDAAQIAADQARELGEMSIDNRNDKIVEATDVAKERSLEAFWANEDKKWQALDAQQTAEAKLDGEAASKADEIAKSALVSPIVAAVPIFPQAISLAGGKSTFTTQSLSQTHPVPFLNPILVEPIIKTAPLAETPVTKDAPIIFKDEPVVTFKEAPINEEPKPELPADRVVEQPLANLQPTSILAPLGWVPGGVRLSQPWLVPSVAFIQPELKSLASSSIYQIHGQGYLAPGATVLRTVW